MKVCGAKTRTDGQCKNKAGYKTNHVGEGKCHLHGGATPIKHGRYSKLSMMRLDEKIKKFLELDDPLDLSREVAQLRAFAEDLMERWEDVYGVDGALLAWHESFLKDGVVPKPRQLPDFSAISTVVDKVGAMIDRIQKHKQEGSISLATMNRVVEQLGVEVVNALKDVKLDADTSTRFLEAVESRWNSIRVEPDRPGSKRAEVSPS